MPIFCISGAPGVGKSTVLQLMMTKRNDLRFAVSATTRAPRPEEAPNRDYFFMEEADFQAGIRYGQFAEHVHEGGFFYGTPASQLVERFPGEVILCDVDCHGGHSIQNAFPGTITIFIHAPQTVIEQRLRNRETGRMDEATIQGRLARCLSEYNAAVACYDYIVYNDESAEDCANEILKIMQSHTEEK